MTVTYNGKPPSRFWYLRKNFAALGMIARKGFAEEKIDRLRRNVVVCLGLSLTASALISAPAILGIIPFLTTLVPGLLGLGALAFGYKAWTALQEVLGSPDAYLYIKDAEENWLAKKEKGSLLLRATNRIDSALNSAASAVTNVLTAPIRPVKALFSRERSSAREDFSASVEAPTTKALPAPAKERVKTPTPGQ